MASLGQSLKESLRKLAYSTSVDQLRKKGVKNVKVVGLDRIVGLIEEAVHRSLRNKLMGLERERIVGDTSEEFLRLLKSNEELERLRSEAMREKHRAEEEIDELRRQIEQGHRELSERLEEGEREMQAQYEGQNAVIAEKLNVVFRELVQTPGGDLSGLRERMFEVVLNLVDEERRATAHAQQAARDGEIDRLQRRLSKLKSSLEESEARLLDASSTPTVDAGISSVYRTVQGIDQGDSQFDRKRELMADIFRANVALQKGDAGS